MIKGRTLGKRAFLLLTAIFLAVIAIFPFYWMAVSSLRTNKEIFSTVINLFPRSVTFQNYGDLMQKTLFPRWMLNSLIVSIATTIIGLFFSTLAGFAFAKYVFRGGTVLFLLIFLMVSIPRFATIIPVFKLMSNLSLTNTYLALILPFAVNPFAVFLMRQYIKSIPEDLLDSARIDGLNELGVVMRIVVPVIKPALGAGGIFILMSENEMTLFPVGLASLKTLYVVEYGMIMAGSLLSTLPLLLGFLLLQRQFVAGLTEGSIKA